MLLKTEEGEWDALLESTIKSDGVREEGFKVGTMHSCFVQSKDL